MSAAFRKDDAQKLRFDLICPAFEAELAEILTHGAEKYSDDNWKLADPAEARPRYYAALRRHMNLWWAGEVNDKESGKPHLASMAFCIMALRWFERKAMQPKGARLDSELATLEYTDHWKVPVSYEP